MGVWKRGWILAMLVAALAAPIFAFDEAATDLTDLSLEELMEVQVLTGDVLGTHTHQKGEWMIGYSFMHMDMGGYRDGTSGLAFDDVLADYRFAAPSMTMDMHMLHFMYAPTDRITLMLMAPYNNNSMEHVERATGDVFTAKAKGLGDVGFSALFIL